ncbi:MAG TPA: alpha-glucan family phosphorylase [Candidatus Binatia bacterium]|nr:alpha-glucan family phosphorylase [Candidatus Binatia bacterium]
MVETEACLMKQKIAYFSMEIGVDAQLPTCCGGLGVLAGDMIKSSAEMNIPLVGVSLRHHKGYFKQEIENCQQKEVLKRSNPFGVLRKRDERVKVRIEGRDVVIGAEEYIIKNGHSNKVPIYFLETRLNENEVEDREISETCYWMGKSTTYEEHQRHRLKQEVVLGIGGVRFLEKLGYDIKKYHMNEGHTALATLEIANKNNWDEKKTKKRFSFTTHTLVPAGHEVFPMAMVESILDNSYPLDKVKEYGEQAGCLNMTKLAMSLSDYQNGVSKKNAYAAREMFPSKNIDYITNAVHLGTWTSGSFKGLFDRHFPGWEENPEKLKDAMRLPDEEVWKAHLENKNILLDFIEDEYGTDLDRNRLTLGWFRRIAEYKRPTLIFTDEKRLKLIASEKMQIIMAGKAHPRDGFGKEAIKKIYEESKIMGDDIPTVFVENYRMEISPTLIAGVDVLLNTPRPPNEASGTSGIKALSNGVINVSSWDGWIDEEFKTKEGAIGWAFGCQYETDVQDAHGLYNVLEQKAIPTFYGNQKRWIEMQKHSISLASYYNANRMLREYVERAWK